MKPIPILPEGTMNHRPRVTGWARRGSLSAVRAAIVIIATAALAIVVAACSSPPTTSSGSSSSTGGASSPSLLSFTQCMRSNGLPNFPDPSSNKFPTAQQLGVTDSKYQTAQTACQRLLPAGSGAQFPAAEVQQLLASMRTFSQCMRSHGVTNWARPHHRFPGATFV